MKRIYLALSVFISVLAFNCQKELSEGPGGGNNNNNNTSPITAALQGNVLDENGQPAAGVLVKVGNKTTSTNIRGYFRIVAAALDKNVSLVTAEKTGYFKAYRVFSATSGTNQVMIKLVKKNLAGTINSTAGGEVTLVNGSKVSLPANAVVKAAGGSYSGTINVYSAYIDPTANDISLTIPGSLTADNKDGNRGVLNSYGMMAVELESSAGEKLQIASGSEATLTMPIPASLQGAAPATISLWYVDEQTGIWKEEGSATKTGSNYVGQVKHFSFWNCDAFNNAIVLSMTLQTNEGTPLVHALVKLTRPTGGSSYGWTDSLGQVSGYVPSNEVLLMEVIAHPCNNVIYSQNLGPYTQNTNAGVIVVPASSPSLVTIHGTLLNCSSAPVTNGYAIIYYANTVRYAATNASGDFTTTIYLCSGGPTTCQILGVDNAAQQQGATVNVPLVAPTTNAGNISACGTSALQYINYDLDGTMYNIASNVPGDSLMCSVASNGGVSDSIYLSGYHPSTNSSHIAFRFQGLGVPGSYPLHFMSVQAYYTQVPLMNINTVVTNYATAPGQFFEGSFSGPFTDMQTGSTHNISCTYRLRR